MLCELPCAPKKIRELVGPKLQRSTATLITGFYVDFGNYTANRINLSIGCHRGAIRVWATSVISPNLGVYSDLSYTFLSIINGINYLQRNILYK